MPNSDVNVTRSSNEERPTSTNLEKSWKFLFEINLTQLFMKSFLGILTTNDAVLKEVRYWVLQNDEQSFKVVSL